MMCYTNRKKRLWLTTLALLFSLHLCVFTVYRVSKNADSWSDDIPDGWAGHSQGRPPVKQSLSFDVNSRPERLVYPNSVIRGGVRTPDEFMAAVLKDSVVAAHFSDFSAPKARILDLKVEKAAYVSYRINDKVYWTKKKVKLVRGEKLITDGTHYARARCGNRISEVSQSPTSAEEPAQAFLDTPIPAKDRDPLLVAAMPRPSGASPDVIHPSAFSILPRSSFRPPGFFIPAIIGGGAAAGRAFGPSGRSGLPVPPTIDSGPGPLPTADVPEPSTLFFLASGLGSAILLRRRLWK